MRNLVWKILLIIVVLGLCVWSFVPPKERIRLGKDLRGGVSLIYKVRVAPEDPDPRGTIDQVIRVLKDRVNPQGVLDISMRPVGPDRIEIVMPLPTPEVRGLRDDYRRALEDLLDRAHIAPGELQRALETGTAVDRFGGAEGDRRDQIRELQDSYEALQAAWDELEAVREAGAEPARMRELQQTVADAELEFEQLRDAVLRLSLSRQRIERALRLPTEPQELTDEQGLPLTDPATGERMLGPSPREVEIQSIREEFPYLAQPLEEAVAAYDRYAEQRKGFDDPEDLMRVLRGAGVLEFRIAVSAGEAEGVNVEELREQLQERGPGHTDSLVARWFPINDLKQWYREPQELAALRQDPVSYFATRYNLVAAERNDEYYLLLYVTDPKSMTHEEGREWSVVGTEPQVDPLGRPAVGVVLDSPGGRLMNRLTRPHQAEPMAIVLDGEVYSAPSINDILGKRFQITGSFSRAELDYLHRVLDAGSLQARLTPEPIAMNTLGPSIGRDNLRRGLEAFLVALVAVAVFMILYYFFAGTVADLALLANGVIIFGVMAMIDGTFTLPGLAGIVLTMGMAVDANVLIYERIREELFGGEVDLRGAIRLGYGKAFSTILDANVTNLIICFVLYNLATTEVKGFALTLGIGICATLFTALFLTRIVYTLYTDVADFRRLPMLATVFPGIHRMLEPSIRWISLRKAFWAVSIVALICSVGLVSARGVDMFDTEFRGGVAVTMRTRPLDVDDDGEPDTTEDGEIMRLMLPHTGPGGVQERVHELAALLHLRADDAPETAGKRQRLLQALHNRGVLPEIPDELPPPGSGSDALADIRHILDEMGGASVLTVGDTVIRDGVVHASSFQVKAASPKGLSEERTITDTVVAAVVSEFRGQLDVSEPLTFDGADASRHEPYTHPITEDALGENIERPRYRDRVSDFLGGVALVLDSVDPPATPDEVAQRISRMRAQPDYADYLGRDVKVVGLEPAASGPPGRYRSLAILVHDPALSYFDVDLAVWEEQLAAAEWDLVTQALRQPTSLEQVSSFSSAVAETLSAQAIVAVFLSLVGILVYIWVRFGSLRYSAAAIVALVHDVTIALGLLAATAWLGVTAIGSQLLIEEFRIDLGVVAALLTIIGYSLNDTIVILDRIRENRGKLPIPTADIVNRSINQTISRTVLTSFTTLLAVGIMYVAGGSGIRPFAFCLLAGLVVGSYSSVAIAAPLVVRGGGAGAAGTEAASEAQAAESRRLVAGEPATAPT